MSNQNAIHLLSTQLTAYQETHKYDTEEQREVALKDITKRVFELETEIDQAFQAGMAHAKMMYTDLATDFPPPIQNAVANIGQKVEDVMQSVVTEVVIDEEPQDMKLKSATGVGAATRPAKREPFV